jgi:large subunit ribosomal protein L9
MKVLLRKNVAKLGKIGDVVEVKPGYARNYLLPHGLAYEPSRTNLRQVEVEKQKYLQELARQRAEIEARAQLVQGKEITLSARANPEGHLYGSVGPAQIVAALAEQKMFIEAANVVLPEPIRKLDKYEVQLDFGQDVKATISVWVVPVHGEGEGEGEGEQATAPAEPPADEKPEQTEQQ